MAKVVVLGGCGAVGSVATRTLAAQDVFSEVVIADADLRRARAMLDESNLPKLTAVEVEAADPESVRRVVRGADVVLNCVGPFYQTVKTVLAAVIQEGIHYVDVCDDVDATLEILDLDAEARRAGITALVGMGSSPGATNVLAKLAASTLLEETDSIDIFHAHGGEPVEGAGVIGHRFHCMSIDIPMYLEGALRTVKFFGADGIALRQTFDFPVLGKGIVLYPYPHPEQVTLPRFIPVTRVTNKGTVLPAEYYDLTMELCRLGLGSQEPVTLRGQPIVPREFAIAYLIRERERILQRTRFGKQRGCVSVVVKGRKNGEPREYRFHLASGSQALGEGTGIPAAMGVLLLLQGKITERGVLPPEGCVNPMDFVALTTEVMKLRTREPELDSFGGIIVEKVDPDGNVTLLDF